MTAAAASETAPARIEYLKARNFRALRDVAFRGLTPMTVLLGPNRVRPGKRRTERLPAAVGTDGKGALR